MTTGAEARRVTNDETPILTDTLARLRELAMAGADVAHFRGYDDGNMSGHTEISPSRCPHPDCVLVRLGAVPTRTDGDCPLGPNHQHSWMLMIGELDGPQCEYCMSKQSEIRSLADAPSTMREETKEEDLTRRDTRDSSLVSSPPQPPNGDK